MDDRAFAKTEASLRHTMTLFAAVLRATGGADVAALLPWGQLWGDDDADPRATPEVFPEALAARCVRAYSLAFQLADQVEENAMTQSLRALEDEGGMAGESGSWEQIFERLRGAGRGEGEIAEALGRLHLEPVLTAHPTEAKRQTVLEHQRRIHRRLVELESSMWTRSERAAIEEDLKAELERLLRTGEIYHEKPSLEDERRMILHYLRRVFPEAVARAERRLRSAWGASGFDPSALVDPEAHPRTGFGNWVGGDRDGHPLVTAAFTQETLELFRRTALELLDERLEALAVKLSLSESRQSTPKALSRRLEAWAEELGPAGRAALERNREEPWRQYVNLMRAALPREGRARAGQLASPEALAGALRDLRSWLREIGAQLLAERDVNPLLSLVRTFGFHLAQVDVRQNSAYHDRALGQLLARAGVEGGSDYPSWPPEKRRPLLEAELAARRPLIRPIDVASAGEEAAALLELHRRLASHARAFGTDGLGALIVSMTRSAEDLLAVFVLAREGELLVFDEEGRAVLPLEVVPLFETIDDLERAPGIMDDYLAHPTVARSLRARAEQEGRTRPLQQVMVGYSDSSKDGGIAASLWSLNRCQEKLVRVAEGHGVDLRFFHGRGGTIGRGAGPTHRFVRALPPGALKGGLRVTEQGETIRQKYANFATAAHHLELLQASALGRRSLDAAGESDPAELVEIMDELAATSRRAYVGLLESPGFVAFFERATPIDAIENSRIGSRPARRPGARKLENLRAIPWVFSWNQSRFVLPGWFGLGSGLSALAEKSPEKLRALRAAKTGPSRWAPVHYLLSNAATAWATASPEIMARYAALAEEVSESGALFELIREEYERTGAALESIYGRPLAEARPNIERVLRFRAEALRPLHDHQIRLLTEWRGREGEARERLVPELLRTINAISSGLGVTG